MPKAFTEQNYLIIQNNVVENIAAWDGDTTIWTPPQGSIVLIQSTTPVMVWGPVETNGKITDWALTEVIGAGSIGFTWDGTILTTNEPKPSVKTISTGVQPA